jgi:choline kinase
MCAADIFEQYPTLMLDSDVLYDAHILGRMLEARADNAILVDCANTTATTEYWLTYNGRRLTGLYKGAWTAAAIGVYWGLHKFAPAAGKLFVQLVRTGLQKDAAMEYWWVTPQLLQQVPVGYVDVAGLTLFEIDGWDEVEWAREHVYPQLVALGQG